MSDKNKEQLLAMADAYFSVGEILKYDYDGLYDQSSIEEYFDDVARKILKEAEDCQQ